MYKLFQALFPFIQGWQGESSNRISAEGGTGIMGEAVLSRGTEKKQEVSSFPF